MGKWLEYLKLLPKLVVNPSKILEGWWNEVQLQFNNLPEDERNEIFRRRVICQQCPFNSINAQSSKEYKELYGENYKTDRDDLHCSICLCNNELKTASLDSNCGLEAYNQKHPEGAQKLKWTFYKKEENK